MTPIRYTISLNEVTAGDNVEIIINGKSITYEAFTDILEDEAEQISSLIESGDLLPEGSQISSGNQFINIYPPPKTSLDISASPHFSISSTPTRKVFIDFANTDFHLIAIDVDGSEKTTNAWVNLRDVTQYPENAVLSTNSHFPQKQFGGGYGSFSDCEIAEFIAFDKVLTTDERQNVEGYLSHRWVQAVDLGIDHPYYLTKPDWTPIDDKGSHLQAWFDTNESSINKNFVKKWTDIAHRNEFLQTELLNRPAIKQNAINGLPAIHFDGETDSLQIGSGLVSVKTPIFLFLLFQ